MATVSITISGNVSTTASRITTGSTTLYTAPANSYAILQCGVSLGSSGNSVTSSVVVGSVTVVTVTGTANTVGPTITGIYVGPGQTVVLTSTNLSSTTAAAAISGVQFSG
jgi:predicted solute-binding protein